jgi:hypothetical protein
MRKTLKNWGIRISARVPEIVAAACLLTGLVVCGLILRGDSHRTPEPRLTPQRVAVKGTSSAAVERTEPNATPAVQKSSVARGF